MRLDMAVPNGYEYDNEITTKPEFGCVLFSQAGRKPYEKQDVSQ